MLRRVLCPAHEEKTPSFILYEDGGGHCFSCGHHVHSVESDLQAKVGEKYVEDLQSRLSYIGGLDRLELRGIKLPYDEECMYIVWPDNSYYKKRFLAPGGGPKYIGAAGHKKTPFSLLANSQEFLILVEGEINALSIKEALPTVAVVSPGGAGDFYSATAESYLTRWSKYANILLLADDDEAGAIAVIKLKAKLIRHNPHVDIHLMEKDANSILQEHGKEGLKTYLETSWMELQKRVSCEQGAMSSSRGATPTTREK